MLWDPSKEKKIEVANEPWRDVLRGAADYIEKYGHAKHDLQACDGGVCLLGGINVVTKGNAFGRGTAIALIAADKLGAFLGMPTVNLIEWNNAPERTKEEVVSALRAAAES